MQRDEFTEKRLRELFERSRDAAYYLFTDFLGLAEIATLNAIRREYGDVTVTLFGGATGCERVIARFGSPEELGYAEDFPIDTLEILPRSEKYAQALTHRDYLGALLNLGIERDTLGDIIVLENRAYVFTKNEMSEFIKDSLERVKHTDVIARTAAEVPTDTLYKVKRIRIQAESERADGIVAKVFRISREKAQALFTKGLVFANGSAVEAGKATLSKGSVISVRGLGRFIYLGAESLSRRGKLNIDIDLFA